MATVAEALALAVRHHRAGALAEAEQLYRQILAADPRHVVALHLLGVLAHQQGRNDLAVEAIGRALRLAPDYAEAHANLGVVLREQGRLDEAVASYRRALRCKPDYADAHNNLGLALREQGRLDEAVAAHREALRLRPDDAEAHNNLGIALEEQGRWDEAVTCYRAALRLRPDYVEALSNLGGALKARGRLDEATSHLREALRLKPDCAEARNNLGVVLTAQGKWDEAAANLREAVRLKPNYAEAHNNLASALMELGEPTEALVACRRAIGCDPGHVAAHLNLGATLLLLGRFEEGWLEYEWRRRCPEFAVPAFPQPWWDGSDVTGKTILLSTEQGLGDTLQFIRYAPLVKRRGATVVVGCPAPLVRLLGRCPGVDHATASTTGLPPFDVQALLLSLPGLFRTSPATIPAEVPYLFADPALAEHWRSDLGPGGFKVAIAWQGNPASKDRRRAAPLAQFEPLARVEGVRLLSLQKGPGADELPALADRLGIRDLGPYLGDFDDTAAVLANMDLVISVDTALAHLAGALGVPAWVALRFAADWRWLRDREDSPWYPTMRLFRQPEPGNWEAVFAHMARELEQGAHAKPPGR